VDEFEVIRRYFSAGFPARDDVVLGVGDDGALTRLRDGEELVTVSDALVAGTHFPLELAAEAVAHRALAANLSDLAAMGAVPRWFTLALALPSAEPAWLESFAAGLQRLAGRFDLALVGGDTVRGPLAVTITALGAVPAGTALCRSGATSGDSIFVTGTPGDAGWAWQALAEGQQLSGDDPLYQRFAFPEPRVAEGAALRSLATAAIDLSDGLHVDLERLLAASGVGGEADIERLPLSAALRTRAGESRARELALTGGDDYELCFTVPVGRESALVAQAAAWPCEVTQIGRVVAEPGLRWREGGSVLPAPDAAFRHF